MNSGNDTVLSRLRRLHAETTYGAQVIGSGPLRLSLSAEVSRRATSLVLASSRQRAQLSGPSIISTTPVQSQPGVYPTVRIIRDLQQSTLHCVTAHWNASYHSDIYRHICPNRSNNNPSAGWAALECRLNSAPRATNPQSCRCPSRRPDKTAWSTSPYLRYSR